MADTEEGLSGDSTPNHTELVTAEHTKEELKQYESGEVVCHAEFNEQTSPNREQDQEKAKLDSQPSSQVDSKPEVVVQEAREIDLAREQQDVRTSGSDADMTAVSSGPSTDVDTAFPSGLRRKNTNGDVDGSKSVPAHRRASLQGYLRASDSQVSGVRIPLQYPERSNLTNTHCVACWFPPRPQVL
jgi:hypothetical protein